MKRIISSALIALAIGSTVLPEDYAAAAVPEGAKVWTGATGGNWTDDDNWSPAGEPASGDDVAFDGSGVNLGTNFNGTAFTLNSLTFTTGQSAPVTITTTNTAQLSLGPASGAGPFTVLDVAAGSHQFTGTNGGSNTTADFRFLGATGTTFVVNVAGSAVFDINGRITNSGGTASNRTFHKTGTGTLILSANNGGTGAWQHSSGAGFAIQQGVLRFAALYAAGNSANNYIVSSGAALELDGNFNQALNNGTYTLNGTGIAGTGALRSLSGAKSITGSGTGGVNLATNASIGVDAGNLTINQVVKGSGSLTKVGAGTLTLSGANTHTGATLVSAGTLALGASEVLSAGQLTLGAATLSMGNGFTATTGRLDVTGAATLQLGTGATIAFAATGDLSDWTGALNITGDFVANVSVRFGATAAGLTAEQLAKITVNGAGGYTLNAAGYLGESVASVDYTYVDATPANTTLNGEPLVDRNANPTTGNYFNESGGSAGTGTDGFWSYRTGTAFATFEGAACFESDSANVSGDAENTPPLVTTITMATPGTYDIVVLFTRTNNRDIAAKIGSAPGTSDIFTISNALNADQNLTPEPEIVFDSSYTNSRGTNTGAAFLGQVTTTTPGQAVAVYVNGFDSRPGETLDQRTQYEGVGYRPANATPPPEPKHYDVYLIAGQSNADGRGYVSDLTGPLAPYAGQQPGVKIFYVNPINKDPVNPTWNTGWQTLEPGYSAFATTTSLPSTRFGIEVSLGKALAANDPERNIAFIKVSQGGTSLHTDWDPSGGANYMWQTFANKVPEAMAALTANGDTAEIRGMFWHQGESDGSNPTFQSDLVEFIAACRTLTGVSDLPFALGELEREPGGSTRASQLAAMANVASADPNTIVVSSAGLPTSDGTHFTSAAYITFGERFAQAYFDFLDGLNFTVTYNGNESTGGAVPVDSRIYNSVATATVLAPGSLVKDGHNFAGWNTQAYGNGTAYAAGDLFVITANTTLYAQWEKQPTPFEIWADDETITFAGDANNDGVPDGMAWLLGAETPQQNALPLLPTAAEAEGAFVVTFQMRGDRGDAVLNLQYGTTLDSWTTVPVPDVTPDNPVNGVTFTITPQGMLNEVVGAIPFSAAPGSKLFIRLSGAQN